MTRIVHANNQPDHEMTAAIGHPRTEMNAPLSSKAVAAMVAPSTPIRMTLASTYMPVPAMRRVRSTCTV